MSKKPINISIIFVFVNVSTFAFFGVINSDLANFMAFGKTNEAEPNVSTEINLHDIETKKIHVGDIDIAYKKFGKGDPILLISGAWRPLDYWDPTMLGKLAQIIQY